MSRTALSDFLRRTPLTKGLVNAWDRRRRAHGPKGISRMGHRDYVGGLWDELGRLQFDYLVRNGLEPRHVLLDIACGSLRAGVHFIPYLEPGHYLGIDKEAALIERGIEEELGREAYERYRPELLVSGDFEFDKLSRQPDFALAQSLFTHLPAPIIDSCLAKLRPCMADRGAFYATFFQAESEVENPGEAHDHGSFVFTRQQMLDFGNRNGWSAEYIGDWKHPRGQMMVRYRPA